MQGRLETMLSLPSLPFSPLLWYTNPMAIEPVKIPQNVNIEDRIIGPVSLRQLFLLLGGGGISYVLYGLLENTSYGNTMRVGLSLVPLIVMAAFAFVTVNNISLLRLILLLIERSQKPTHRVWAPRRGITLTVTAAQDVPMPTKDARPEPQFGELGAMLDKQMESDLFEKTPPSTDTVRGPALPRAQTTPDQTLARDILPPPAHA